MKKLFFTAIALVAFSICSAQGSCACDEMFGSCNVSCPKGTYPSCKGTWYSSCICSCIPFSKDISHDTAANGDMIFLKDLDKLQNVFTESKNGNLVLLSQLKIELSSKSVNGVFKSSDKKEYDNYINILKSMFSSLDIADKVKLVSLIES